MMILGLDPGETTGWCLYDSEANRATASGVFEGAAHPINLGDAANRIVIERVKGYGASYPAVVEAAYVCGRLVGRFPDCIEMTRKDICKRLTAEMYGQLTVRNDRTAWAALKELHGGESSWRKGGPLYGVRSHGRAALAVAVAYSLPPVKS